MNTLESIQKVKYLYIIAIESLSLNMNPNSLLWHDEQKHEVFKNLLYEPRDVRTHILCVV